MTAWGNIGLVTRQDIENEMRNLRREIRIKSDADPNAQLGPTIDYLSGLFSEDLEEGISKGKFTAEQAQKRNFVRESAVEALGLYQLGHAPVDGNSPLNEYFKVADQLIQHDFLRSFE